MPSGTSLCAVEEGGTQTEAGTAAKPPLILPGGVSTPRPVGRMDGGTDTRGGGEKGKFGS